MRFGIIGQMRAGKTTAFNYLSTSLKDNNPVNLRLSDPIYEEAKILFDKYNITWFKNRRLLEGIGELFNSVPGDLLILTFKEKLLLIDHNANIFTDDVRTIQQAKALREEGFILIRISASEDVRRERSEKSEFATGHYSDTELVDFPVDFDIDNNSTFSALQEQLDSVLRYIKEAHNGTL